MTKNLHSDAIELLKADHDKVKAAFKEFETLRSDAYELKNQLADLICSDLTKHALIEEEIFYPAIQEASSDAEDMLEEALVEHACAKALIAEIESMSAEEELFDAKVKVLSEQIEHHIQEEENEMFPLAEEADIDLVALGKQMKERKEELDIEWHSATEA